MATFKVPHRPSHLPTFLPSLHYTHHHCTECRVAVGWGAELELSFIQTWEPLGWSVMRMGNVDNVETLRTQSISWCAMCLVISQLCALSYNYLKWDWPTWMFIWSVWGKLKALHNVTYTLLKSKRSCLDYKYSLDIHYGRRCADIAGDRWPDLTPECAAPQHPTQCPVELQTEGKRTFVKISQSQCTVKAPSAFRFKTLLKHYKDYKT